MRDVYSSRAVSAHLNFRALPRSRHSDQPEEMQYNLDDTPRKHSKGLSQQC